MKLNLRRSQRGFTLVEILIVVIILAILAGVIIPQFSSSTDDAKVSVLKGDLSAMRAAIELYYHQHNSTYPGAVTSNFGGHSTDVEYFVDQLTLYTNSSGEAVAVKDAAHKYGPYIKSGIPVNPFNDSNVVVVDTTEADLTATAADNSTGGWMFFTQTGQMFANDGGGHSTF